MEKFSHLISYTLFLFITSIAFSDTLISSIESSTGFLVSSPYSSITYRFGCGESFPESVDRNLLIWTVNPSDVGHTFHITADMDSDFEYVASMITNGQEDWIGYFCQNSGTLSPDTFALTGGAMDLYGYRINSISLTLNSIYPDGNVFYYDATYGFWGEPIPEPGTLSLLAFGGLALLCKR